MTDVLKGMEQAAREGVADGYAEHGHPIRASLIVRGDDDDNVGVRAALLGVRAAYAWLEENGYVVVPKEPTAKMVDFGDLAQCKAVNDDADPLTVIKAIYRAMIAVTETNGPVADGWLPIETAPMDGRPFLLASKAGTGPTIASFSDGYIRLVSNREKIGGYGVWFWRPLPAPPVTPAAAEAASHD